MRRLRCVEIWVGVKDGSGDGQQCQRSCVSVLKSGACVVHASCCPVSHCLRCAHPDLAKLIPSGGWGFFVLPSVFLSVFAFSTRLRDLRSRHRGPPQGPALCLPTTKSTTFAAAAVLEGSVVRASMKKLCFKLSRSSKRNFDFPCVWALANGEMLAVALFVFEK